MNGRIPLPKRLVTRGVLRRTCLASGCCWQWASDAPSSCRSCSDPSEQPPLRPSRHICRLINHVNGYRLRGPSRCLLGRVSRPPSPSPNSGSRLRVRVLPGPEEDRSRFRPHAPPRGRRRLRQDARSRLPMERTSSLRSRRVLGLHAEKRRTLGRSRRAQDRELPPDAPLHPLRRGQRCRP